MGRSINITASEGEIFTTCTVNATENMENSSKSATEHNVRKTTYFLVTQVVENLRKPETNTKYLLNDQDLKSWLKRLKKTGKFQMNWQNMLKSVLKGLSKRRS